MKYIFNVCISILILVFTNTLSFSQNFEITRQKAIGGEGSEKNVQIKKLSDGYLLAIESASGATGLRTIPSYASQGNQGSNEPPSYYSYTDIWIVKVDNDYNILWQKAYGCGYSTFLQDLDVDEYGNAYITMSFMYYNHQIYNEACNITDTEYIEVMYVIKIDSDGNEVWQKRLTPEEAICISYSFALTGNNGFGVVGLCYNLENYNANMIIVNSDVEGEDKWRKEYITSGDEDAPILIYDSVENVFYAAVTSDSDSGDDKTEDRLWDGIDEGADYDYDYKNDVWLLKINAEDGEIIWDRTIGTSRTDELGGMVISDNYIYLSLISSGYPSGTRTCAHKGGIRDIFTNKIDKATGAVISDKAIGCNGYDGAGVFSLSNLILLPNGNLIYSISAESDASFDKTENCIGSKDIWLVVTDGDMNVIADKTIGTSLNESYPKIIYNDENDYTLCVSTVGTDHDMTVESNGSSDIWLFNMTINTTNVSENFKIQDFDVYPNPSNGTFTLDIPENSTAELIDIAGKHIADLRRENNLDLPAGVYFVKVKSEDGIEVMKLVIE